MKPYTLIPCLTICILLTGCTTLQAPERPLYRGVDNVSRAEPSQLVGTWVVTELNPYPDSQPQATNITYSDDGKVIGSVRPSGNSMNALGDMEFELRGNWSLEGDVITHSDIRLSSTVNNPAGSLLSQVFNNQQNIAGQANIYELSPSRMVAVGSDGAAMEYIRQ